MSKTKEINIKEKEIEFNKLEYAENLKNFNNQWCEYWKKKFADIYKDNNLIRKIKTVEVDINICIDKIKSLQIENENLLEENIQLGIKIDDMNHIITSQVNQIRELELIVGGKPKGLFDVTSTLIKQRFESKILKIENDELKQTTKIQQVQQVKQTQGVILQATSVETVEKILELKNQGLNYTEISKMTKVSTATVSRYINKNKNRLNQMQYLSDNSNI